MTSQADRIEQREIDGIAWSIRDIVLRSAFDDQPSTAACGVLARVREAANPAAKAAIDARGVKEGIAWKVRQTTLSENISRTA